MRIRELTGWPPAEFQCSEQPYAPYKPEHTEKLLIASVTFIPGNGKPGDAVLRLADEDQTVECTARLKIPDQGLARRALAALTDCKGLTLTQAGMKSIPEE